MLNITLKLSDYISTAGNSRYDNEEKQREGLYKYRANTQRAKCRYQAHLASAHIAEAVIN